MKDNKENNGLYDGVYVIEKDNQTTLSCENEKDMIHNNDEKSFEKFEDLYYEEGYTVSEYDPEEFCKPIALLSSVEDVKIDLPHPLEF